MKSFITTLVASSLLSIGVAGEGAFVCPGPNWSPSNLCVDVDMTQNNGCWTIPWQTLGAIGPDNEVSIIGWICSMWVEPGNCFNTVGNFNSGGIEAPGIGNLESWNDGQAGTWTGYWFTQAKTVQCIRT
ncbi:hypothetical protein TARUN_8145 [Trichoderma arundinaceum]|uniref:Uncharacterized protein n=1 Tax=Trichoderma arundinaceum TaxID=490622 RepID=A0A395NDB3_TRIAR|nr:hypothetical protein TARUN_8145 [Trichoderma arundinaceum]